MKMSRKEEEGANSVFALRLKKQQNMGKKMV
jgi:hypothetical protein